MQRHPEAICGALTVVGGRPNRGLVSSPPCHPDRSEARWSDLLLIWGGERSLARKYDTRQKINLDARFG